jgi:FtsP/CotA-like multicopper oxidase with cupredoxin domain
MAVESDGFSRKCRNIQSTLSEMEFRIDGPAATRLAHSHQTANQTMMGFCDSFIISLQQFLQLGVSDQSLEQVRSHQVVTNDSLSDR